MLERVLYALRPPHIDCFRMHAPTLVVAMERMRFVRASVSGMDGAENLEKNKTNYIRIVNKNIIFIIELLVDEA